MVDENSDTPESSDTPEIKKTPKPTDGRSSGTGNFVLGIIVPLVAYYFISFQLYSKSYTELLSGNKAARADVVSKVGILKIVLLAVIFISMYGMNTSQMKQMCPKGTENMVSKVFLSTFIPFIFMLGSIVVALTLMPGWKAPFSNTIGYSIVKNVFIVNYLVYKIGLQKEVEAIMKMSCKNLIVVLIEHFL